MRVLDTAFTNFALRGELTDSLGFCEFGYCLIEANALAILNTNLDRSTDRRSKNIHKQIAKGIAQPPGALRNLAAGVPLSSSIGQPIAISADIGSRRVEVIMVLSYSQALIGARRRRPTHQVCDSRHCAAGGP